MVGRIFNGWDGREWPMSLVLSQVGDGWAVIIDDLVKDLFQLGWDGEIHQVKEKFGELRFYIGVGSEEIHHRIEVAEFASRHTCEKCGDPGVTSGWGGSWLLTLCPLHGAEQTSRVR